MHDAACERIRNILADMEGPDGYVALLDLVIIAGMTKLITERKLLASDIRKMISVLREDTRLGESVIKMLEAFSG